MRMARKRNLSRKPILYKSVLSFCLAILLALQTVTFTASANQLEEPEITAPESSVTEAVYGDPEGALIMPLAVQPGDKTELIVQANPSFPLEVKQNNAVVAPNGTIMGRQTFTMRSTGIRIPVHADNPEAEDSEKILQNDYIVLDKATFFPKVDLTTTGKQDILINGEKIATATFAAASIRIDFNGLAKFFTQAANIFIGFEVSAKGDVMGLAYGESIDTVIFGSQYRLENPNVTPNYNITLTSPGMVKWDQYSYRGLQSTQFIEGAVTWQSTISAFDKDDATIKLPLDGKKFFTDTANNNKKDNGDLYGNVRGVYVPGSFKVNGSEVIPGPDVDADGKLSYTFPEGTGPDPLVEYKVWIPKESYYYEHRNPPGNLGRDYRVAFGIVKLLDENDVQLMKTDTDKNGNPLKVEAGLEISFAPDWIQQYGVVSKQDGITYVTWTIDVNKSYLKQELKNFTITDALPSGLSFVSAAYQTWDTKNWSTDKTSITPDANSIYSFGDLNVPVRLVIVSRVDSGTVFKNWARANWNLVTPPGGIDQNNDATIGEYPSTVSDYAEVTVGAHGLTKSSTLTTEDLKIGATTWTVALAPQYEDTSAVVYDLLIHSKTVNFIDSSKLNDPSGQVSQSVLQILAGNVRGNTGLIGQRYLEDSFSSNNGLTGERIKLYQDGEYVADLLKVTGYAAQSASFTFRTLLTDPAQFAGQYSKTGYAAPKYNRVHLFDGDKYANISAESFANRHGDMLDKGVLYTSKPLDVLGNPLTTIPNWNNANIAPDPGNINQYIASGYNDNYVVAGYDRVSKTVTFRLAVNHKGLDTELMKAYGGNRVASDIQLVDTLPDGWEFVPFNGGGQFYELYKGFSSNNSDTNYGKGIKADTIIPLNSPGHVVNFEKSGKQATFTFSKLEGPYVILVKAKPSNEKLNDYIESGVPTHRVKNKADLSITWGTTTITHNADVDVIVNVDKLSKSVNRVKPGVLEWTVDYTPPFTLNEEVYLQDTLGAGMNLRKDGNGNILLTRPSMAVYRATMNPDGSLKRDGEALNLSDPDSEVKVTAAPGSGGTTILKFVFDNPNQFYQLVYQTEIDANANLQPGDKLGNGIKLMGDPAIEAKNLGAASEYTVDSSDVQATGSTRALLELIKQDPDGNTLAGVEFQLFKTNGDPATDKDGKLIKGITGPNGKIPNFYIDEPGSYVLKQTYIDPLSYLPTTHEYQVYVGSTPWKPIWVDGDEVDTAKPLIVPTPVAGKLTISNKVEGNAGDEDKEFSYIVTFNGEGAGAGYTYTRPDNTNETTDASGKLTFTLKHNQTLSFPVLPAGLGYTVTQTGYSSDGYITDPGSLVQTGSIPANNTAEAPYVNSRNVGDLRISNTVEGNGLEPNKEFEYTVIFNGAGEGGSKEYTYIKQDNSTGTIKSGETINLKHNETAVFKDILAGTDYTVTQTSYSDDGYSTNPATLSQTGSIATGAEKTAPFINKRTVYGTLLIDNTVTGNGGDKTKGFDYTVTFTGEGADEEHTYTKTTKDGGTETGTLTSGEDVSLKDGEKLTMTLPKGLAYTVKQTDYTGEDYITTPSGLEFTGTIEQSQTAEAKFINHKDLPGNLSISNTVIGNGANPDKEFEYTVNFTGAGAGRTYTYYQGDTSGTIASGDKIWLKHEQTVTIIGILKGTSYTVTQQSYAVDEYTTDPASLTYTGVIQESETAKAPFENARYLPGTLALEPKVQKVPGDGKTPAELTATLTGTNGKPVEGKVIVFTVGGVEIGRATTDKDGKATIQYTPPKLTDVTPEEYEVTATTTATSPSGVPYNEDTAKVITMPAALTGVLRDNQTGQIIPDADIIVKNVKTDEEYRIKTDGAGRYYQPVQRDEEYTITYTKMIPIGGVPTPVPFTQKGIIEDNDPTTEGNLIPAEITAVGIVLFQQPDGQSALLNSASTPHMKIYLKDAQGNYIEENGKPKAFPMAANGTFAAEGLTTGTYTMEVRYEVAPGKELRLIKDAKLNVLANGELNISQELVDPYGIVYDANKGIATGQIEGATVTLYYADTDRNRNKGITPGTKVTTLPTIPDFVPNFNKNPEQDSDVTGSYAYMVFPETDYYLIVTKSGYQTYISPTISVEWDIVKHNVPMQPNSSSGNSGGNTGGNTGNNPGTDGGNPPGGNNGTDNGNPPDGNNGSGKGIDARPPEDDELDNVPKTGDSGASSTFYMALALIALIGLLIAIPFRKKKIN